MSWNTENGVDITLTPEQALFYGVGYRRPGSTGQRPVDKTGAGGNTIMPADIIGQKTDGSFVVWDGEVSVPTSTPVAIAVATLENAKTRDYNEVLALVMDADYATSVVVARLRDRLTRGGTALTVDEDMLAFVKESLAEKTISLSSSEEMNQI